MYKMFSMAAVGIILFLVFVMKNVLMALNKILSASDSSSHLRVPSSSVNILLLNRW